MSKKILCLLLVLVMCFTVCSLPVSADWGTLDSNGAAFISHVKDSYQDYRNGIIDFNQFMTEVNTYIGRYMGVASMELLGFGDLLRFLESIGCDVDESWDDFYFQRHGGGGASGNRDILNGHGALLLGDKLSSSSNPVSYYYYCDYIIALPYAGSPPSLRYDTYNTYFVSYNADGSVYQISDNGSCFSVMPSQRTECSWSAYGDVRFEDGSSADDYTTPFPDETIPSYDDSSVSQDDLEDFLEDLLNQLSLQFPDLSTVEGLLSAILSKLDTLDSDDDSALLGQINAAIISLANNNQSGNEQLITTLNDLKESISGGSSTDLSGIVEQLKGLQNSLDYLCTVSTLDMGIEAWDKLTDNESKFLNEYAKLITSILPKFGFTTVNNMLDSLNAVVLNTNAPAPLTTNIWGEPVVILSTDTFSGSEQYISLAKTFISVLLVYSFCLMFRRKVISGGD